MFMLAEKQEKQPPDQPANRFWIDPSVEVALNARINEHFVVPGDGEPGAAEPPGESTQELMDRYNRQGEAEA